MTPDHLFQFIKSNWSAVCKLDWKTCEIEIVYFYETVYQFVVA